MVHTKMIYMKLVDMAMVYTKLVHTNIAHMTTIVVKIIYAKNDSYDDTITSVDVASSKKHYSSDSVMSFRPDVYRMLSVFQTGAYKSTRK